MSTYRSTYKYRYNGEDYYSFRTLRKAMNVSFPDDPPDQMLIDLGVQKIELVHEPYVTPLEDIKESKISSINQEVQTLIDSKLRKYSAAEINTFNQQIQEAKAALDGAAAIDVPMLSNMVQSRKQSAEDIANRIIEKSTEFSEYAGGIIGRGQYLKDCVESAKDANDVASILIDFT